MDSPAYINIIMIIMIEKHSVDFQQTNKWDLELTDIQNCNRCYSLSELLNQTVLNIEYIKLSTTTFSVYIFLQNTEALIKRLFSQSASTLSLNWINVAYFWRFLTLKLNI